MQIRAKAQFSTAAGTHYPGDVFDASEEEAQRHIDLELAEAVAAKKAAVAPETMAVTAPETGMRKRAPTRVAPKHKE